MCRLEMVERMIVAVRAGDHAQAAVFARGIGQVDHREPLLRPRLVALGFGPAPPVLMPEQRRAARGLGDQEPAGPARIARAEAAQRIDQPLVADRSEEHTSELQSLMRISYAVFCLKKKKYKG